MKENLELFKGWSKSMTKVQYIDGYWKNPEIISEELQSLHPAAMGVQFGVSVFEGLKSFKLNDNSYNIFRLKDNYKRFKRSCDRLLIPCPTLYLFQKSITLLTNNIDNWNNPFSSDWLYIRPIIIANDSSIFPIVSKEYSFYVFVAPLREFTMDLNLYVEKNHSRAAKKGLGSFKTASNYAHQFLSTKKAKEEGFNSILWLDDSKGMYIEEANTMNIFIKTKDKIFTPKLNGTILPGITRDTVIKILKKENIYILETDINIKDLIKNIKNNEILEVFATSTGLGIKNITSIYYNKIKYYTNSNTELSKRLSNKLKLIYEGQFYCDDNWINNIQFRKNF